MLDKVTFLWYIITMKATKEHFEFTAALINAANNGTPASVLTTLAVAKFEQDNPRFDAERFVIACGNPLAPPTVACMSDTGTVTWSE